MATVTLMEYSGPEWSIGENWSGGSVPVAGDSVEIVPGSSGGPLDERYGLLVDASEGPYASLSISDPEVSMLFEVDPGVTLSVTGDTTISAGYVASWFESVLATGTFHETGGFVGLSRGLLAVAGQATFSGGEIAVYGGNLQAADLAVLGGNFEVSANGGVDVADQVGIDGGAVGFYGGALSAGSLVISSGSLEMSDGSFAVSGQATLAGGVLDVYGGNLNADAFDFSGGSFGISGGAVAVANQVTVDGGTLGFYGGALSAGSLAVSSGSLGMSGGSITVSGALTLSGGSIGLYNQAATLSAGSLTQTGGSLGMSGGTLSIGGLAEFTGGTNAFYAGAVFNAGSLQVGSDGAPETLSVNGGILTESGTATIASGSTFSIYGGSLTAQGGIVDSGTISGSGTLGGNISGNGLIYAQSGTLDITGNISSGPTLQIASGGDLKIDGTAASEGISLVDVNQVLEIGANGSLTINGNELITSGTILMEGGTLSAQSFLTGAYQDSMTGFGTINGTQQGLGNGRGATITASGGELTINGDIYEGNHPQIAAGAIFDMNGNTQLSPTQAGPVVFQFLADSGTLLLGNAAARQSFEANGVIGGMTVGTTGQPSTVLDLADVSSGSVTSASVANGNTIELFNGSTLIDQFGLASAVGPAVVHWAPDSSGAGTNIFLSTT